MSGTKSNLRSSRCCAAAALFLLAIFSVGNADGADPLWWPVGGLDLRWALDGIPGLEEPIPAGHGLVSSKSAKNFITPPRHQRAAASEIVSAVASANNSFAFDVFGKLRETKSPGENVLISPLSISTALAMTYAGARGRTAEQMADVLHLSGLSGSAHSGYGDWIADLSTPREGYELNVVNRLFGEQTASFKQPYLDLVAGEYHAPLQPMNFVGQPEDSRGVINGWIEDNTNNRIQNLLPEGSVSSNTALVLANAVYFDGDWKRPFDEELTEPQLFHMSDGSTMLAPTMRQVDRFAYGGFEGYTMLEMPYAGDDLSMVIILPDEMNGLEDIEQSLSAERLQGDIDSMRHRDVIVEFPKFTFGATAELAGSLQQLGMTDAFSGGDFGAMADLPLGITGVYHQAFIEVSETGTEAAAATAIAIGITSVESRPPPPELFRADHPFVFAIRDTHTNGILFLGRMAQPTLATSSAVAVPEPAYGVTLVFLVAAIGVCRRACRQSEGHLFPSDLPR